MSDLLLPVVSVVFGVAGFFWGRRAFDAKTIPTDWLFTRTRVRASLLFALGFAFLPTTLGIDDVLEAMLAEEPASEVQMMLDIPKVKAHTEGMTGAEQEAALIVLLTQGLPLLPDAALIDRVKIQADLLKTLDAEQCKHFLEGTLSADDTVRSIEELSPAQSSRWQEMKLLAVDLSLTESARRTAPTQEAVTQAFLASIATLPKEDSERLTAGLSTMGV